MNFKKINYLVTLVIFILGAIFLYLRYYSTDSKESDIMIIALITLILFVVLGFIDNREKWSFAKCRECGQVAKLILVKKQRSSEDDEKTFKQEMEEGFENSPTIRWWRSDQLVYACPKRKNTNLERIYKNKPCQPSSE